jgi:hypothetical protein
MQDTLETFTQRLIKFYGNKLANPEQYPKTFEYQVQIFVYIYGK